MISDSVLVILPLGGSLSRNVSMLSISSSVVGVTASGSSWRKTGKIRKPTRCLGCEPKADGSSVSLYSQRGRCHGRHRWRTSCRRTWFCPDRAEVRWKEEQQTWLWPSLGNVHFTGGKSELVNIWRWFLVQQVLQRLTGGKESNEVQFSNFDFTYQGKDEIQTNFNLEEKVKPTSSTFHTISCQ